MNVTELIELEMLCDRVGVKPPAAVSRADKLLDLAKQATSAPRGGLLALKDDEVADRIQLLSLHHHATEQRRGHSTLVGMRAGLDAFTSDLLQEVEAAVTAEADRMIEDARAAFDAAAAPFHIAAQEYGWTSSTTLEEVIDRADEKAAAAWRALPQAIVAIEDFQDFRTRISQLLKVSPTEREVRRFRPSDRRHRDLFTGVNYSVCFAAHDNWDLTDGYMVAGQYASWANLTDWLALAARGLRLNTPTEVEQKLDERFRARLATAEA